MNKPNNNDSFANEQTPQWLTVKEAAQQLGITERGVQLQVKRGKIRSKREEFRLLVCLNLPPELPEEAEQEIRSRTNSEQERFGDEQFTNTTLYSRMDGEITFLRAQVETHQQNEAELRRLMLADKRELAELREQVKLLTAPPSVDASQASQETWTQAPESNVEKHRPEAIQSQAGGLRAWWARLRGI